MIAEKRALPVALPFWGGFRRILAVTGGRNANEFAVSGLFGGACLGLQNLHRQFKSARRLQFQKSGLNLQILAVLNGGHLQIKNLHPGYKFGWGASKFISKIVRL